jgi:outer membrane lipoprotein SlyB
MRFRIAICAIALLVAGCANKPIIDTKGVNMAKYDTDLVECDTYADQVHITRRAAGGAVAGAVLGAVVGAVVGNSETAAAGAGAGGAGGAYNGADRALREKDHVVKNCLRHRGYVVLN